MQAVEPGAATLEQNEPVRLATGLWQRLASMSAGGWLLLLVAPVGLFLVFAVPPFQGLDEPNHFYRAYALSGGVLVQPIRAGHQVAELPACVPLYASGLWTKGTTPVAFHPREFWTTPPGCEGRGTTVVPIDNTANYSLVSYLPHVIGVAVARALGGSAPVVFYSGRMAGLIGYLALVGLALRLAPRGQTTLLVVASLPMATLLATEFTADSMTIALALLLVASVLRCRFHPDATWRDFVLALVAAVALALTKTVYGPMAVVLLLAPSRLFPTAGVSWAVRLGGVALAAGVDLAWYRTISGGYFSQSAGYDPPGQLRYILHHPRTYAKLVVDTLVGPRTGYFTWQGFISWVGFGRSGAAGSPAPPPLILALGFVTLAQAWLRDAGRSFIWSGASIAAAALPLGLLLTVPVLFTTGLYLSSATVGAEVYWGVQGRYFLPLAALPVLALCLVTPEDREQRPVAVLIPPLMVMMGYLVVKVLTYFY